MTIEKGQEWGRPYNGSGNLTIAQDDVDLAARVVSALRQQPNPVFSVQSGDVARSLGFAGSGQERAGMPGQAPTKPVMYTIDLGRVELGRTASQVEAEFPFVAHVIGGRHRFAWPNVVAMNAPMAGSARLGPRAHLNDGLLDITTGRLPWRQIGEARHRATTGTHLPHPGLTTIRRASFEMLSEGPLTIKVDGLSRGRWHWVRFSLQPDAFTIVMPPGA